MIRALFILAILSDYFIWWTSPRPIVPESIQVVVTGGALVGLMVASDGKSGEVRARAQRECLTIDWSARTIDGTYLHTVRSWRDGCDKFYLPLL